MTTHPTKYHLTIALGLALTALWAAPQHSHAATISPIRTETKGNPGDTVQAKFKLTNDKPTTEKYFISTATFENKDETGEPQFTRSKQNLATWISVPSSLTIAPKETIETTYTITIPREADPGGYFAAIFASTAPPREGEDANITFKSDLGTLVLLTVNGEFKEGEAILEFNTKSKQTFFTSLPVEFYYRFQNSGDDRVKPVGDITIKNIFGGIAKKVSGNQVGGNILPKSVRKFEAAWVHGGELIEQLNPTVEYQPQGQSFGKKLRWEWEHFAFGKYSATIKLTVNNDTNRSYSAQTSFIVFPWHVLLVGAVIALIILIPLIGFIVVWRKLRKKSK